LQSKLLPRLSKDISTNLSNLRSVLEKFNDQFYGNIFNLNEAVGNITENTKLQCEFLDKLEKFNIQELTTSNVKVFKKLSQSGPLLNEFISKQQDLNSALQNSTLLTEKINNLLGRISNFEKNINNLGDKVAENDDQSSKVMQYLATKLDDLNKRYVLIKETVDKGDDEIKDYFTRERETIEQLFITTRKEIEMAFSDLAGENNAFAKLHLLDNINDNTRDTAENLKGQTDSRIVSKLEDIHRELSKTHLVTSSENVNPTGKLPILKRILYYILFGIFVAILITATIVALLEIIKALF
jgi:ABC-type transporter Mla subunit MlaD